MADDVLEQIAALKDEDWAIREEAASALGEAQDSRAVVPLVGLLNDPDRSVRQAAIEALTSIGHPAVVPLGECLGSTDLLLQESASSVLATIADDRVLAPLLHALMSSDWIVRMHAVKGLGLIGARQAVTALMPLLQDKVKAVREETTHVLAQIGDCAVPELLEGITHPEWLVRLHAVEALGKTKSARAVKPLLSVLFNDADSAVRVDAARSLGEIGDPQAVESLLVTLKEDPIRPVAIEALGKIGDPRAVPTLLAVVNGSNKPAKPQVVHGCGDSYDSDMEAMAAAVRALAQIRDERVLPTLVVALQNTVIREEAAVALVAFGAPAIPLLLAVLRKEKDENIVYHVRESLRRLGWRPNRI